MAGGQGSGAGPKGGNMPAQATPTRGRTTNGGWTPTVANLLVLVLLEIAAYCALRWAFRTAHGG